VTHSDPEGNRLVAEGPVAPSSEALTHGMVYALDEHIRVVMHVHSPDIWKHADELGIAATSRRATYGTPEMAAEVRQLLQTGAAHGHILVMGGHEDGVISFGETTDEAGRALCDWLLKAFKLAYE
jgi:ribulose-5-phosphate 4-epimerase/fuculose-1-phosphate aldolase